MKTILLAAGILLGWLNASLAQGAGTKIWDYSVVSAGHSIDPPALGPDGTIYLNGVGSLYALDANGNLKANVASNCGDPIVAGDGTVYVAQGATLYAYDATLTNTVTPVFTASAGIISDIVLGADGTFYFGTYSASDGSKLQAVNPDGTLKWQYLLPVGSDPGQISLSTDGTIYFSSWYKFYALTPGGTKKWVFPAAYAFGYAAIGKDGTVYVDNGELYALYPESTNPNGTKKWQFDTGENYCAPVIGADGTIYVAGGNYVLYAVNPNGTKKWEFQAGDNIHFSSAAIGRDGTIYVGCDDHFLYAVNPDGSYRWGFETGGQVESSPVIGADGTVYIGSQDGKLYAIKGDAVSDTSPWPMFGRDLRHSGRVTCPKGTPCFDTERMMTNGAFDMVLIGKAGTNYGFDVSANLTD